MLEKKILSYRDLIFFSSCFDGWLYQKKACRRVDEGSSPTILGKTEQQTSFSRQQTVLRMLLILWGYYLGCFRPSLFVNMFAQLHFCILLPIANVDGAWWTSATGSGPSSPCWRQAEASHPANRGSLPTCQPLTFRTWRKGQPEGAEVEKVIFNKCFGSIRFVSDSDPFFLPTESLKLLCFFLRIKLSCMFSSLFIKLT